MVTLEEVTIIHAPLERCFDLARSVEVHLAGNIHCGEEAIAAGGVTSGLVGLGDRVTWRARHFGMRFKLTSEITAMNRPVHFQDRMIRGPFKFMEHDHFFRALSDSETEMKDVFRVAALCLIGPLVDWALLRRYMQKLLRERNDAIRQIAESEAWRRYVLAEAAV